MQNQTPQAVQAAHELLVWLIPQLDKFPRARRFTLDERLEAGVLAIRGGLLAMYRIAREIYASRLPWDKRKPKIRFRGFFEATKKSVVSLVSRFLVFEKDVRRLATMGADRYWVQLDSEIRW